MLEHSSQYKEWFFMNRKDELEALIQTKEGAYKKEYQKILNKMPQAEIQTFTIEDENAIFNFYISQFQQLCSGYDIEVEGTATTFFKRFMLKTNLLHHDLKKYIYPCFYMALKIEEVPIKSYMELAKAIGDRFFKDYSNIEQELLKVLNFDLKVYSHFTQIQSLVEKLKVSATVPEDKVKQIYQDCLKICRKCFLDNMIFEIPHGIIGVTIFLSVLESKGVEWKHINEFSEFAHLPEEVEAAIKQTKERIKKNEEIVVSKEKALQALNKIKSYHTYGASTRIKDDFIKPPEKHIHVQGPNEHINLGDGSKVHNQKSFFFLQLLA